MASPRTLFEKIWERHVVLRREGQCLLYVDRHIIHDGSFHAFANLGARGLKVRRPQQTIGTPDHYVPTVSRSPSDAPTVEIRRMVETFRTNVATHGIPAFQLDDDRQGIVHIVGPEQGITQPGFLLVWLSPHTRRKPGSVMPCSGPTIWTMPWRSSSSWKAGMPCARTFSANVSTMRRISTVGASAGERLTVGT